MKTVMFVVGRRAGDVWESLCGQEKSTCKLYIEGVDIKWRPGKNLFRFFHWQWKTLPNWYTVVEYLDTVICSNMCKIDMYRFKGMHTIWLDIWACSHFPPWVHPAASIGWTIFHPWFSQDPELNQQEYACCVSLHVLHISVSVLPRILQSDTRLGPGSECKRECPIACLPTAYRSMSRLSHGVPTHQVLQAHPKVTI